MIISWFRQKKFRNLPEKRFKLTKIFKQKTFKLDYKELVQFVRFKRVNLLDKHLF